MNNSPQVEVSPAASVFAQGEWECGSSLTVRLAGNKSDKSSPTTQQQKEKLFVPAAAENTSALVNNEGFCLRMLLRGKGASAESCTCVHLLCNQT